MSDKSWEEFVGDIDEGRKNLGDEMPVSVYRLFEYTMKETLMEEFGEEKTIELFRKAGFSAGIRFAYKMLNLDTEFNTFIAELQKLLKDLKIGILRLELFDPMEKLIIVAIGEDLDCSGLPVSGETVCNYDEGFLKGIMKAYTKEDYEVKEIDCWANGGRICRFQINQ